MKRHLFLHLFALLSVLFSFGLWSCSEELESMPPEGVSNPNVQTRSMETPEDAVYHEATASWVRHKNDPYALDNFKRAYESMQSAGSARFLSRAQTDGLSAIRLEATHYSVKIYPRNEQEQWELEQMEDVKIAYIPFDYVLLSDDETSGRMKSTAQNTIPDERRYAITHEDYETTEGIKRSVTIVMPVLYGVWPCTKPFPAEMDYEVLYEVFLPEYTAKGSTTEAMYALENEAIRLATGHSASTRIGGQYQLTKGFVNYFDNFIRKPVPMQNLLIRAQLGSRIWDRYLDQGGSFSILETVSLSEATLMAVFLHSNWKITSPADTNPIVLSFGRLGSIPNLLNINIASSTMPVCEIHLGMNYYFFGNHTVPKKLYTYGCRIVANPDSSDEANGYFHYEKSSTQTAFLEVFNKNRNINPRLMGTIFHELGHYTQFCRRGGTKNMLKAANFLIESYGSYAGWYLCEAYYTSLGWKKPGMYTNISGNARQNWPNQNDNSLDYTPLLIDLVDDLNQCIRLSSYAVDDQISNASPDVIDRIVLDVNDWAQCKSILGQYVGRYYNSDQLNRMFPQYDLYFSN